MTWDQKAAELKLAAIKDITEGRLVPPLITVAVAAEAVRDSLRNLSCPCSRIAIAAIEAAGGE